jgi:DNA-directed RNA polymerase specialized sigma24 family protein
MTENLIVKELQGIATKLTSDPDVQKDLMQEMFLHLVRIRTVDPDRALSWYLKSCEFHARNFLRPGEHTSSANGERNGASFDEIMAGGHERHGMDPRSSSPLVGQIEIQGELITGDVLDLILPLLSEMQQQVLFLLMKGCGVREAGRELGITHPAVIKHRKKIARIAHELLQESEGIGVAVAVRDGAKENGNGHGTEDSHSNGDTHQAV